MPCAERRGVFRRAEENHAMNKDAGKGFRCHKAYPWFPLRKPTRAVGKATAASANAHLGQTTKAAQVHNQRPLPASQYQVEGYRLGLRGGASGGWDRTFEIVNEYALGFPEY